MALGAHCQELRRVLVDGGRLFAPQCFVMVEIGEVQFRGFIRSVVSQRRLQTQQVACLKYPSEILFEGREVRVADWPFHSPDLRTKAMILRSFFALANSS